MGDPEANASDIGRKMSTPKSSVLAPPDAVQDFEARDAVALEQLRADLGGQAVRSAAWRGAASFSTTLVRLGMMAYLARKLTPGAFGIVAISSVIVAFALGIFELGLGSAIVQRPRITAAQLWWVFKVNMTLSLCLWAVCIAASPWVSRFFQEPLAGPVLVVSGALLPISAVAVIPRNLLTRRLEFKKLAVSEIVGTLIGGVVSVWLAVVGLGVWSLVLGSLSGYGVTAVSLLMLSPWRPHRSGRADQKAALLRFGVVVAILSVANNWAYSVDNLVVGRLLGATALGLYSVAFNLAMMPVSHFSGLATSVAFPAFAAIQADRERLAAAYIRCLRFSAALSFPVCAMLAVLAPQLVAVYLGPKWASAATPLRLLLAMAAARSLYMLAGSVLRSVGRPQTELVLQAVFCLGVAVAAAIGARAGINGVAAAVALFVCFVSAPLFIAVTAKAAGTNLTRALLSALAPAAASALGGLAALGAVRAVTAAWPQVPALVSLAVGLVPGLLVYAAGLRLVAPDLFSEAVSRLRVLLARPPRATVMAAEPEKSTA
jgi:PST family polysaccharide transporter